MQPPVFIGSAAAIFGYLKAMILREPIVIDPGVVRFLSVEQRKKIIRLLKIYEIICSNGLSMKYNKILNRKFILVWAKIV